MSTNSFHDSALERDKDLTSALCHTMERDMVRDIREWIEAELKALIFEAQLQQSVSQGIVKDQFDSAAERLQLISRVDLPDAIRECSDAVSNVRNGFWGDVYDAYDPMSQALGKLWQIVRALLELRGSIAPTVNEE